jgi:hypothetical protein
MWCIPDKELRLYKLQKTIPCDPKASPKWDLCGWARVPLWNKNAQEKKATWILWIKLSWEQLKAEHIPGRRQKWGKGKESRMFWIQFTNCLLQSFVTLYRQYQKMISLSYPQVCACEHVESKIRSQQDKKSDIKYPNQQLRLSLCQEFVYKSFEKTSQDLRSFKGLTVTV